MSEQDFDFVICPNCVHEFRAVPVNVQEEITRLESKVKELEAKQMPESSPIEVTDLIKLRCDMGYRAAASLYQAIRKAVEGE